MAKMFFKLGSILLFTMSLSCGYWFVSRQDRLPGGGKKVSIPVFQNRTQEIGLENVFTSALRNEFFRSKVIQVVSLDEADSEIQGIITSTSAEPLAHTEVPLSGRSSKILANEYRAKVDVSITLVRRSDQTILWQRNLSDGRQYSTGSDFVKNEDRQQEAFKKVALYLMEQAHDAMLEDF